MSENSVTPTPESQPTSPPKQRSIMSSALRASFLTYLVIGVVISVATGGFEDGFVFGCVNFVIALPFTLLAVFLFRQTKMSARWELLAAILAGIVGIVLVGALLL